MERTATMARNRRVRIHEPHLLSDDLGCCGRNSRLYTQYDRVTRLGRETAVGTRESLPRVFLL
jgi:hypothetical protein